MTSLDQMLLWFELYSLQERYISVLDNDQLETWPELFTVDGHYEIVTYPGVSEKTLSVNSLRSIFSMHLKTWSDGTKIRVFVLPDDDQLHQSVSKEKLNVFPYQLINVV